MPWITEQVLLAGAGIHENNWQEVVDLGITAVVNLRTESQDVFGLPPPIAYLWLPTEDHTDPTPEQLLLGAQFIHTLVQSGQRVLVHCKMGIHRSATTVVAYLIYSGMEKEEAIWLAEAKRLPALRDGRKPPDAGQVRRISFKIIQSILVFGKETSVNIQLIQVPYDSGHKDVRAGRGPGHFLQHGLDRVLREAGHQVTFHRIEAEAPLATEIGTAFELNRLLAERVRAAVHDKAFPVVLAGNCNSCLGTLSGISQEAPGVIWFDAHGDFNTPETTLSGFFDGMGLAIAAGRCWRSVAQTIPGFQPVSEANILHIGARDLDAEEKKLMEQSEMGLLLPGEERSDFHKAVEAALDRLQEKVHAVYVHVDMDVLDTGEALPNRLAVPDGLSIELMEELIARIRERFEIRAGAITSFEPEYDKDDQVLTAGIRIVKAFVA